jgi:hypothetical protein
LADEQRLYYVRMAATRTRMLASDEPNWRPFSDRWDSGFFDGPFNDRIDTLSRVSTVGNGPDYPNWQLDLWYVQVHHWPVLLITLILPAIWLRGCIIRRRYRRRLRRSDAGLCPECGYDVRVTPGRCPECGAIPVVLAETG